jgi:hypothetical protein
MRNVSDQFRHFFQLASMLLKLIVDAVCYLGLCLRPSPILAAENLFLRKQLALYQERQQSIPWNFAPNWPKVVPGRVAPEPVPERPTRTGTAARLRPLGVGKRASTQLEDDGLEAGSGGRVQPVQDPGRSFP